MYYVSNDKKELENYNDLVCSGERYDGVSTTRWAMVITHKDGNQFAILKHKKYDVELVLVDNLNGWFETIEI